MIDSEINDVEIETHDAVIAIKNLEIDIDSIGCVCPVPTVAESLSSLEAPSQSLLCKWSSRFSTHPSNRGMHSMGLIKNRD